MQTKTAMSPVAAQAVHDKLVDVDRKVAEQMNVINTANTAIAQATVNVTELWRQRQQLAEELDRNADPAWQPSMAGVPMAAPSSRRFWKPAPMPLISRDNIDRREDGEAPTPPWAQ